MSNYIENYRFEIYNLINIFLFFFFITLYLTHNLNVYIYCYYGPLYCDFNLIYYVFFVMFKAYVHFYF